MLMQIICSAQIGNYEIRSDSDYLVINERNQNE
jgi:hypothetical protein